jgi:hypothetical protein
VRRERRAAHPVGMSIENGPIRGEVRQVGFRRVAHGLFLRRLDSLPAADELIRDLEAWLCVLPTGAVFTHVTGARLLGWRLPTLPEQVPVFAAVHGGERRTRRPGLICSRLVASDVVDRGRRVAHGLPVDAPEEILLRCARDLGHLDLVVLLDSAIRRGDIDRDRMAVLLASRRPGVRALSAAWAAADPRSESGGETVLRIFHEVMDVPVEPQVDVHDDSGRFVARADLLVIGTTDLHEYDGAGHRDKGQHRSDLRRERRLANTPFLRRGFTLDDLINHPAVVMHELDQICGRAHQQGRLRRWRRMVDHSLYSTNGRARVMNRWRREMGTVDWSRTA